MLRREGGSFRIVSLRGKGNVLATGVALLKMGDPLVSKAQLHQRPGGTAVKTFNVDFVLDAGHLSPAQMSLMASRCISQ
jgi:hypothetical protein